MADPFRGEIRAFPWDYAPENWALCNGDIMSYDQNQGLYALLYNAFGGDGKTTFGLPDLRGRTIVAEGQSSVGTHLYERGDKPGVETVALTSANNPAHTHTPVAWDDRGSTVQPFNGLYSSVGQFSSYAPQPIYGYLRSPTPLAFATVPEVGVGEPHDNMQPFAVVNFCIALVGEWPSRW